MNINKFANRFDEGWAIKLRPFIESKECDKIYDKLREVKSKGRIICPDSTNTYRVFKETPYKDLKCVFLFDHPYSHLGRGGEIIADGIGLSCAITEIIQTELDTFYRGIENDLHDGLNTNYIKEPDLSYLGHQGIMMLNVALTCEKDKPEGHFELWKPFMRYLFEEVFTKYDNGLIFVICGSKAKYYERFIYPLQHHIVHVEDIKKAAYEYRPWNTDGLFNKLNKLLKENYNFEPDWLDEQVPF